MGLAKDMNHSYIPMAEATEENLLRQANVRVRVTYTDVYIEQTSPIIKVKAKPLINPELNIYKIKATMKVVMLASKILEKALS